MSTLSNINSRKNQKINLTQWKEKLLSIFKNNAKQNTSSEIDVQSFGIDEQKTSNPYLAARTEWNFMYNDVLKGKKNWQWVALAMIFANMLLILGMTRVSLQSKAPLSYITKVDSQGNAQFGGFLSDANQQVSSTL